MTSEETHRGPDVALQKYSLELLTCIDDMKYKRDTLHKQILSEMQEKEKLQCDLRKLTDTLVKVNEKICDRVIARNQLDETIKQTEQAFLNLATGSENLLNFMKKVTGTITPLLQEPETLANDDHQKRKKSPRKSGTPKK